MAGNPELCLSTDEWKAKFLAWIRAPTPQALLNANIVFDFRPLYGDTTLCDALREWLFALHAGEPGVPAAAWCRTRSRPSRRSA